ncbi:hypothetical protein CHGG_09363 [Chaetomium globosum CBS 148.51]|uniref:Major facilitator superfamily (MFS) profile domain-containing protein n=1 Tax=Chaetomium globosum (strain ATCC 6205 / CBS 148.51 / DSM 1962 / NBRC 6347 / NRRL 1970) TaxID=306901 RepID=Q2GRP1_CHAGB|nr:uncharacterized protein CHGG_09363 [Chaetomium globosum CBS 148.51]EAQ85349.1 hypothetical protein CHGG_09363 [Chaetomium globosum CBS 148.51]
MGLIRATEAIAWTSIFPYAYFMIQSFEVPENDIAFYSGALIAVFTFGEFLTGVIWGRISDKIGRKPTLLIGILCGLVTSLTLGLSRSVSVAIASRAFGGLFNPNVGLKRKHSPSSASSDLLGAFFLSNRWNAAAHGPSLSNSAMSSRNLTGPVLGGLLADPAALYPSIFPRNSLWTDYPYLLPNLVVGLLQVLTLVFALLVLQETHPQMSSPALRLSVLQRLKSVFVKGDAAYTPLLGEPSTEDFNNERGDDAQASSDPEAFGPDRPAKLHRERAFTVQVMLQVLAVSLLAFHKVGSDSLMGTFLALESGDTKKPADEAAPRGMLVPRSRGGFGFDTRMIGIIFLAEAIFRVAIQPTAIP